MIKIRRPLGLVACMIVIVFAMSALRIPIDFMGIHGAYEAADQVLSSGQSCHYSGQIYHKEIKAGGKTVYYLRDATLSNGTATLSQISIFLSIESDLIPLFSYVSGTGKVYCLNTAHNEGNFDEKNYYNSLGLVCGVKECEITSYSRSVLSGLDWLYRLRRQVVRVYDNLLPSEESGVLSAIALGDKAELDAEVKEMFLGAGIVHILAVSGLHISLICMGLFSLLRKSGFGFGTSGLLSSTLAALYVILAGMSVSSLRAGGMFLIYMLAQVLGEAYDMVSAISFMAVVLLFCNPMYVTNSSFIFSFGAAISVCCVAQPVDRMLRQYEKARTQTLIPILGVDGAYKPGIAARFMEKVRHAVVFSICITLGTLPLACYFNFQVPLLGVVLNIFLLPFLPLLLGCGLVGGILGCLIPATGAIILFPCHLILFSYEWIADHASEISSAIIICGRPSIVRMVLYVILQLGFVQVMSNMYFSQKGDIQEMKRVQMARLIVTLVGMLLLSLILMIPSAKKFEIDMLDVGQGDGIYVCSDEGTTFFIDGGSSDVKQVGKYRMLPFLKYKGVGHVDYWFVTHTDKDHVAGIVELLEAGYRIDNLILSKSLVQGDHYEKLMEAAEHAGTNIVYVRAGDACGTKSLKFTCIFPTDDYSIQDANAMSMVLLMGKDVDDDGLYYEAEDYVGLFTGDTGAEQERLIAEQYKTVLSNVDLLKVAHHGSKYSSCEVFLETVKPDMAIISCGKNNSYGHPHTETLERIKEYVPGARIYRTDQYGQISICVGKEVITGEMSEGHKVYVGLRR